MVQAHFLQGKGESAVDPAGVWSRTSFGECENAVVPAEVCRCANRRLLIVFLDGF